MNLVRKFLGLAFRTPVPDSIFKNLLLSLIARDDFQHIISNNEGEACALATGYHLGTGKIPIIYLQNSGLGNCVNPLTSLLDTFIYSIPALLLITWRGHPEKKDEPQHLRMGKILPDLLSLLNIPFKIAVSDPLTMKTMITELVSDIKQKSQPHAILFIDGVFEAEEAGPETMVPEGLTREYVLELITQTASQNSAIVTTTGKTSRELYELREKEQESRNQDFLTVGSMGCSSAIAFGLALAQPERPIILIDGDGACLMRLESLALIGHYKPENLLHVIINNEVYESTGSQKTLADTADFVHLALACQYASAVAVSNEKELLKELDLFVTGPKLIVVKVIPFSRANLARPKKTPLENKQDFMNFIKPG